MSENNIAVAWLADSSLLICFGALPQGADRLLDAYGRTVGVTPTVRFEMDRISKADAGLPRGIAASAFAGRHASKVHDVAFERRDEPERQTAHEHIARRATPATPPAALDRSDEGKAPGSTPWKVEHAGEAETVAVAVRTRQGLLMTDEGGRLYAEARNLEVHSFTRGLRRLTNHFSPRQLHQMWLKVRSAHDTGLEVVRGPNDFRTPPAQPR